MKEEFNVDIRCFICRTEAQSSSITQASEFLQRHVHRENQRKLSPGRRATDTYNREIPGFTSNSFLLTGRRRGDKWWQ